MNEEQTNYYQIYKNLVEELIHQKGNPIELSSQLNNIIVYRSMLMSEPLSETNEDEWFNIIKLCSKTNDENEIYDILSLVYLLRNPPLTSKFGFYQTALEYAKRLKETETIENSEEANYVITTINKIIDYIQNKKLTIKLNDKQKSELYDFLKPLFENINSKNPFEDDLLRVLEGYSLFSPLHFISPTTQLIDVFVRLKNNNFIENSKTDIQKWLCHNFTHIAKNNVKSFSFDTCKDYFSGKKKIKEDNKLIKNSDWL